MPKHTRAQRTAQRSTQTASLRTSCTLIDPLSTAPVYFHREHTPPYGFLSQWFPSPFHDPAVDITYNCAEQRMMHHKALLCNDIASATAILASREPGEQKTLGRSVKGWKEYAKEWERIKYEIVEEGNWLKFTRATEHAEWLRESLLGTGERELVEASGSDRVWGIGFSENVADGMRAEWGQNLLGRR